LYMLTDVLFSLVKGLCLGGSIYALGIVLDHTVSLKSTERILKEKPEHVSLAHRYISQNLLLISPLTYVVIDSCCLQHRVVFHFSTYLALLLTQNLGYFFIHREFHRNRRLYPIHEFHHRFDKIVSPSIGNAVTNTEFCMAYIAPFIAGAFLFRPTEITFLSAIGTVGLGNMFIHTYELKDLKWVPGLVAPSHHIKHHEVKNKHYAAPIFDLDAMFEYVVVEKEDSV
jgi:sterol desaturase/sphingolipid hydroxylase (fatty acid hydroxylase superfamily)